jgi:HEAT repeat protein
MAGALAVIGKNHPDKIVPILMITFTTTETEYRDGIAGALASFGNEARPAIPILLTASRNQYFSLRMHAAVAVKIIAPETPNALAPLIRDLESPEMFVRQQTIYTLGGLGTNGVEAIPALLKCLSYPDSQTRLDAEHCLFKMGVTSDAFLDGLVLNASHTNYSLLTESVSMLKEMAKYSEPAFLALLKAMSESPTNGAETEGGTQARFVASLVARSDPKFLINSFENPDPVIRFRALQVFCFVDREVPASVPVLQKMATNDPNSELRKRASEILRFQQQ